MNNEKNNAVGSSIKKNVNGALLVALVSALAAGCWNKAEPECEAPAPVAAKKKTERKPLQAINVSAQEKRDKDWCRACVMGPKGWASCQTAYAFEESETRESLKGRAREKACDDAGFEKNACPDKAVLAVLCKGEDPPSGSENVAKALQSAFLKSKAGAGEKAAKPEQGQKPEPK